MAIFYTHLHEHDGCLQDEEGIELASLDALKDHVLSAARELIAADALTGVLCFDSEISVTDKTDEVYRLKFADAVKISGAHFQIT